MMTSRTGAPRSNGFTYLELIIVLTVMAVLAAVLAPQLGHSLDATAFRQTHATLATTLAYAQTRAVTLRRPVRVAALDEPPAFQVESLGEDGVWQPLAGRFGRARRLPRDVTLTIHAPDGRAFAHPSITFDPDGHAEDAVLRLATPAGRALSLTVDAATGQVHAPSPR